MEFISCKLTKIVNCLFLHFQQKSQNETYVSMVNAMLNTPFFYFSYTYDLTHSLQRLSNVNNDFYSVTYLKERFFQYYLLNSICSACFSQFLKRVFLKSFT